MFFFRDNKNFNKYKTFYFILTIFTLRTIFNFYGFNIVPFLSINDEVIIQDPSIYFNKIGEFKALSFFGYLIDKIDSHHPPLFVWSQSQFFNIFGFNQFTLRYPSIIYSLISLSLIIYSLKILSQIELCSKKFIDLFIMIILLDPTYLSWSRMGRNDCLANLFFTASITLLLLGYENSIHKYLTNKKFSKDKIIFISVSYYISASIFLGLSIATHIQYIFGYFFLIAYIFLIGKEFIAFKHIFYILVIPPSIFLLIWIMAFKNNLISSFEILNTIQSKFSGTETIIIKINALFQNGINGQVFSHMGGTLLIFNIIAYLLAFLIIILLFSNFFKIKSLCFSDKLKVLNKETILQKWVYLSIFILLLHLSLLVFKFGLNTSRFYSFIPISIIAMPILIQWILEKYNFIFFRKFISFILFSFLFMNSFLTFSYLNLISKRIIDPSYNYNKVENSIKELSKNIKYGIAAPPVFWLAMHRNLEDKNIHIIDNGFAMEKFISKQDRFNNITKQNIDFVLISQNSDLINFIENRNSGFIKIKKELNFKNNNYKIYKKLINKN